MSYRMVRQWLGMPFLERGMVRGDCFVDASGKALICTELDHCFSPLSHVSSHDLVKCLDIYRQEFSRLHGIVCNAVNGELKDCDANSMLVAGAHLAKLSLEAKLGSVCPVSKLGH